MTLLFSNYFIVFFNKYFYLLLIALSSFNLYSLDFEIGYVQKKTPQYQSEIKTDSINHYLNIAKSLHLDKKNNEVISYCYKVLKLIKKEKIKIPFLELIGEAYKELKEYHKSILYYKKALYLREKENLTPIDLLIELARVLKKLNDNESLQNAIAYLNRADSLSNFNKANSHTKQIINNNLGNYYSLLFKKKEAFHYYNKSLSISKKINDKRQTQATLINLALLVFNEVESTKKELVKSKDYYKLALKIDHNEFHYYIYKNLGIISYLEHKPREALDYHNKAINNLLKIKLKNIEQLPLYNSEDKKYQKDLLDILFEKYYAWIKYYYQTKNKTNLKYAQETLELADYILDDILVDITDEKSQLFWRQQASYFYFLGVHISALLKDVEKGFYYIEKNKALLLLNKAIENKIKSKINIPKALLDRQDSINKEIYSTYRFLKNSANDSLQNELFEKKIALDYLNDSILKNYPKYRAYNKFSVLRSLKNVKTQIADSTLYLSYIWDKTENQYDALYGIAITKDTSEIFKITGLVGFENKVKKFKALISEPFRDENDIDEFQKTSYSLYLKLFPTKTVRNLAQRHEKLVIFPDGDLQNIPFEALTTKANSNNYLINTNEISYAYSASFLIENKTLKRKATKQFIGFAPHRFNYDDLQTLPRSKSEVRTISNLLNGQIFNEDTSTKQHFFSNINDYKIIHLSTHANANDSISPWIAFKNEKLYLEELYTTKTQADLVFLSACKSSLGKINAGEGVYSLARGFFYSGANSVISSLWNANDKSGEEITTSFYKQLKQGQTKSAALRQAKLNYLKTHSLSEISPYYWSSLILVGDNSAMEFTNYNWVYVLFLVLLSLLVFYFSKKIKLLGNK